MIFAVIYTQITAGGGFMITAAQNRKIHVLRRELRLDDGDYRAILANFADSRENPIHSSAQMTAHQAGELIELLEGLVDREPGLAERLYATSRQVKKIFALWRQVSRADDASGIRRTLRSFLRRRYHVSNPDRMPRRIAPKVIKTLSVMKEQQAAKESRAQ